MNQWGGALKALILLPPSLERDDWKWGPFLEGGRNLVQWKLPGTYQSDSSENLGE